jgi:hypothetical protein
MQNKIKQSLLLVIAFAITFWSCRKQVEQVEGDKALIETAKAHYTLAQKGQANELKVTNEQTVTINQKPLWAESHFLFESAVVVVPLDVSFSGMQIGLQKFLVFKFNKDKEISEALIYRILNKNSGQNNNYISADNKEIINKVILGKLKEIQFSGLVQKYDINGNVLGEYRYNNGDVTVLRESNNNGAIGNNAPGGCSTYIIDHWWLTYLNGVLIEIELEYSTEVTTCPTGGGGSAGPPNTTVVDSIFTDNYVFTCPDNFTFTGATIHNLWQQAGISNSYCNLARTNPQTGQTVMRQLQVPIMYFGMPYKNQTGGIIFTPYQASVRAANAINEGEYAMRTFWKNNPNASDEQLRQKWISMADAALKEDTYGQGMVTKTPSANPTTPPVINPYSGCY